MCKRRILYIEDDPAILAAVQILLESKLPVAVDTCTSAAGAEQFVNRYCYDLIISDIGLPVIDGIQILDKILQRDPGQPVMLLSEYTSSETISAQAARIGVPITPKFCDTTVDEFVGMVAGLINKRPCPEDDHGVRIAAEANPLQFLTFIIPSESKARMALQLMGCTIAGACKLHQDCLERARRFGVPAPILTKAATATPMRIASVFLLLFPWFIA